MVTIRSVLGDARQAEVHPGDGFPWYNCPFCSTGVYVDAAPADWRGASHSRCDNPWCLANPAMPLDAARIARGAAIVEDMERARRQHDHDVALQRIRDDRAAREELAARVRAEAESRGACVACALRAVRNYRPVKFVRHRGDGCTYTRRHG